MPPIYYPYFELDLHNTLLSTESFQQLFHSGISNFAGSDLTQVDLQAILHKKSLGLDFSNVNLENSNLKELDFSQIKLYGSNLKNTNLVNSLFSSVHLDESVNIEGAELTRFAAFTDFLNAGIKQFDGCKIIEFDTISQVDNTYILQLEEISFRKTQFSGHFNDIDFISCDLRHAKFIPLSHVPDPPLLSNLKFFDCRLEKIEFHQSKFMEPFKLQDCSLREVILKNIEMPASILFKFYQSGHRNFNSVYALKGKIPEKLPPMPLLQASLSKQSFIHLYKQGVRDFRASNLYGFLLSEVLVKEGISEINLKLEGAHYQQSLLGCASSSQSSKHTKRSPSLRLTCNFYFILQKENSKKAISWQDLLDNLDENKNVFKEVVLGHKPLYRLKNPDTLNFYWAYKPDHEALAKAVDFIEKSTEPTQRNTAQLYFYFVTLNPTDTVKNFAKNLYQLGFRKGQLIYPITKNQLTALDLTAKSVPVVGSVKLQDKFFSIKEKSSITSTVPKNWRTNMQRRIANMKTTLKGSLRYSLQEGIQYDLALVLMDLIALWLYQVDTPEPKNLDVTTRLALQEFASQIVDRESIQHRANDHQHSLTLRLALQCIERGECSTPELIETNIMNTLQTLKPDVQIGFEVMWEKIKNALSGLGEMISKKFNDIEKNFRLSHSVFTMVERYKSSSAYNSMKSKRKIYDWYEQPQLTYFIKNVELVFIELGYDLNMNPSFSESLLAGYLYDLWSALIRQSVSNQTSPQIILQLLENESFRQSTFDSRYLNSNKTFYPLDEWSKTELYSTAQDLMNKTITNRTSLPIDSSASSSKTRKKRSMLIPASVSSLKSSATRSLIFVNTMAHYVIDCFYSLKARMQFNNKTFDRRENKVNLLWPQPTIKPNNMKYVSSAIAQAVPLPGNMSITPLPYTLDTFNSGLFLANYVLKIFSLAKSPKQDEKNNAAAQKASKKLTIKIISLIKKVAEIRAFSLPEIYQHKMGTDLRDELTNFFMHRGKKDSTIKKSIFHLRNKIRRQMEINQIPKLEQQRFITALNEALKPLFLKQRSYYPSRFIFFKSILDEHADDLMEKNQFTFKV